MKLNSRRGDILGTCIVIALAFLAATLVVYLGGKLAEPYMNRYKKDNDAYTKQYEKRMKEQEAARTGTLEKS